MLFQLIPSPEDMYVEGQSSAPGAGRFRGRVLAIGVHGSDPVAAAGTQEAAGSDEGMLGWGTTYFLVSDASKPAPVWVVKDEIESHRVGHGRSAGDPSEAHREQLAQEGRLRQTEQEEGQ